MPFLPKDCVVIHQTLAGLGTRTTTSIQRLPPFNDRIQWSWCHLRLGTPYLGNPGPQIIPILIWDRAPSHENGYPHAMVRASPVKFWDTCGGACFKLPRIRTPPIFCGYGEWLASGMLESDQLCHSHYSLVNKRCSLCPLWAMIYLFPLGIVPIRSISTGSITLVNNYWMEDSCRLLHLLVHLTFFLDVSINILHIWCNTDCMSCLYTYISLNIIREPRPVVPPYPVESHVGGIMYWSND